MTEATAIKEEGRCDVSGQHAIKPNENDTNMRYAPTGPVANPKRILTNPSSGLVGQIRVCCAA